MVKLNQGADTALVSAATKAGLASAPPSYARTFENVAANYDKTMKANSDMWGKIINSAVSIGISVDKGMKKRRLQAEGIENLPNGEKLVGELKGVGGEMWETRNLEGGWFGKEARAARGELRKRKDTLIAWADGNSASDQVLTKQIEDKTIDKKATGIYGMEVIDAYTQTQVGGTSELGNYFVPEAGEDGEMGWTMHNDVNWIARDSKTVKNSPLMMPEGTSDKGDKPNGEPVIGDDGKKIRYNVSDINQMITPVDPKMPGTLSGIIDPFLKVGANSGGNLEFDKYTINKINSSLEGISSKRSAWFAKNDFGEDGKSFHGELTEGASVASANLFGQLSSVLAEGSEALERTGILTDVDGMSDGVPGIQAKDFQNEDNYNALTMTLFNPGNKNYDSAVTGKIFQEHMMNKIKEVQVHGWSKSSKNPVNKPGYVPPGQGGKLPVIPSIKSGEMFEGGGGDYVSEAVRFQNYEVGKAMVERASLGKGDNKYTWDDKKKTYFHSTLGVVANKASMFAFINKDQLEDDMGMSNTFKSLEFYRQIPDWDGTAYLPEEKVEEKRKKVFGIF